MSDGMPSRLGAPRECDAHQAAFLDRLRRLIPDLAGDADREDGFAGKALDRLRGIGALEAALPPDHGGLDLGADRQGAPAWAFMRLLGEASVALARLTEGHVNALRLICRYGAADRIEAAAQAAAQGELHAIWVTDGEHPLAVRDGRLSGGKAFCSGAGQVGHALVTAVDESGLTRMFVVNVAGVPARRPRRMTGVRGAATADVSLDGIEANAPLGEAGDYLRQPEFSAGAWRGSAIASGALDALVGETIAALIARDRHRAPHQAARIGRLLIARDTARLWSARAADAADGSDAGEVVATVNLARIAVEQACLEAIVLVQRGIGLAAFAEGARIERLLRDLATYLRQPAPDETLHEAALWFADHAQASARC